MSDEARQQLVKRSFTESECEALAQVWEDEIWSAYPAMEAHKARGCGTTARCSSTRQKRAGIEDEDDNDSHDASISTSGSEYSFGSQLEEELSSFEANVSDSEADRDFSDLTHTKARLHNSLYGKSVSSPREIGAVTTREETTQSESDRALEDLILRFGYFLITQEYEDGKSSSTLLIYFSGVLGI
jgi:hypothetical protein